MVAICKSIYVVYNTNSTHKFLPSGLFKYFCMGENGWRVSDQPRRNETNVRFNLMEFEIEHLDLYIREEFIIIVIINTI